MKNSFIFLKKKLDINSLSRKNSKIKKNNYDGIFNSIRPSFEFDYEKTISNIKLMETLINPMNNSILSNNSFRINNNAKKSTESLYLIEQIKKMKRRSHNSPNLYPKKNQINTNIHNKNKNYDFRHNSFGLSFGNFDKKPNITLIDGFKAKKQKNLKGRSSKSKPRNSKFKSNSKVNNSRCNNSLNKVSKKNIYKFRRRSVQFEGPIKFMQNSYNDLDYYKDNNKMMKINEHIKNEIGSIELKKKINLMRKSLNLYHNPIELNNLVFNENNLDNNEEEEKKLLNISKKYKENAEENNISHISVKSKTKTINDIDNNSNNDFINSIDQDRRLIRKKELYDSFDDEECDDEEDTNGIYISPSSAFIKIFDYIVFICSMFYLIFVPYLFSKNMILSDNYKFSRLLLIIIDFIYILDVIFNFFRPYQTFDENLIKKKTFIFLHYVKTWFFLDFIQCFPFFTLFKYLEGRDNGKLSSLDYEYNRINPILYLLLLFKIIKVYKMVSENSTISIIEDFFSTSEVVDNYGSFVISIFFSVCFINLCSCIFIFLGDNTYPGWIMRINIHDETYLNKYITSVYFILVTITTVGYGDISGNTYPEIVYQMFLLIIGTIAYSFVVSYISNYIVKINQKSMTFEKNVGILEEIRLNNPYLKDSLYKEVLKNLHNEQLYEKKDKTLLYDCLPYSLKNKLIMEIYKPFISNFIFFKDIENSDFIVKVVTSLKPLLSFKGELLVQEGDYIKEIFFVNKGSLGLYINIDTESPENSIRKYLNIDEQGKIVNISYTPLSMIYNNRNENSSIKIENHVNTYIMNKRLGNRLKGDDLHIKDIKIIEIRKKEYFGVALMFLDERSPLSVKVKTKIAELFILKKMEAIEIYSIYPNTWKRINKKSLYNMEQVKLKILKELLDVAVKYGAIEEKLIIENCKGIRKFMSYATRGSTSQIKIGTSKINKDKSKNELTKIKEEKSSKKLSSQNLEIKENNKQIEINNDKIDITFNHKSLVNNQNTPNNKKNNALKLLHKKNIKKTTIENRTSLKILNQSGVQQKVEKRYSEKEIIKYKDKDKDDFSLSDINTLTNTHKKGKNRFSLQMNLKNHNNGDNNSNICIDSDTDSSKNKKLNISNIKNEKILLNTFSNLSTRSENSFQLNSSYENINNITNNKYIKDNNLQSKTKQFLVNECSGPNIKPQRNNLLLLKNNEGQIILSNKSRNFSNFQNIFELEQDKRSVNSLDMSKMISNRSNNKDSKNSKEGDKGNIGKNKKEKNEEITKVRTKTPDSFRMGISKNLTKHFNDIASSPRKTRCKSPKRRKVGGYFVNEKLDIINKNMNVANKNINNPDEFYMDLFNNIIKRGTLDKAKQEKLKSNNNFNSNTIDKEKNIETGSKINSVYRKSAYSIAEANYEKDKNQSKPKVLTKYGKKYSC